MENILKRFSSLLFGGKSAQELYESRVARMRQENSNAIVDEAVKEDALKGTTQDLALKYNSLKKALQVVFAVIVIPFNIPISIYNRVKRELENTFDPIDFGD
jgi:hypothetical protein